MKKGGDFLPVLAVANQLPGTSDLPWVMLLGMTPELLNFHRRWLKDGGGIPAACRPHFYNLGHRHQTVFVMHTPLENRLIPPERSNVSAYVEACRKVLLGWFGEEADLWNRVAQALPENAVGTRLTGFCDLIEHAYFTDVVKCESTKKDRKAHVNHTEPCVCDEFKQLLNRATLFIAVGSEAWAAVRDKHVRPLSLVPWPGYQHLNLELAKSPRPNLTDVHGVLFRNAATGQFVIPVAYPGGQSSPLRNSYIEYLKDGLAAFSEVKTSDDGA